jgi:hypothetical protein
MRSFAMSDEPINQEPTTPPSSQEPPAPAPFVLPSETTTSVPKNNRTVWIVIGAVAILLVLCCCLAAAAWGVIRNNVNNLSRNFNLDNPGLTNPGGVTGATRSEDFNASKPVDGVPTITVNLAFADVQIETGAAGEVAVRGQMIVADTTNAPSLLQSLQPQIRVTGDQVTISNDWQESLNNGVTRRQLEVTIVIPSGSSLTVKMGAGRLVINETQGDLSINIGAADVELRQVEVERQLDVQTGAGRITYEGAVVPNAAYSFKTGAGAITLSLPANSSFHLNASSNVGNVTCDFELSGDSGGGNLVGKRVQGDVGPSPTATLDLTSAVGQIDIRRVP